MFIPVGPDGGLQDVWNVDKDEKGTVTKKRLFGVRVSGFLPNSNTNGAGIP
jgi:protein-L-isoaspartate O-methyltransferase